MPCWSYFWQPNAYCTVPKTIVVVKKKWKYLFPYMYVWAYKKVKMKKAMYLFFNIKSSYQFMLFL